MSKRHYNPVLESHRRSPPVSIFKNRMNGYLHLRLCAESTEGALFAAGFNNDQQLSDTPAMGPYPAHY